VAAELNRPAKPSNSRCPQGHRLFAFHGAPRFTEDIALMVLVSPENADKLFGVIESFGFGNTGITREDFLEAGQVIQLGRAPNRIDRSPASAE
jgi:hypothetical protein